MASGSHGGIDPSAGAALSTAASASRSSVSLIAPRGGYPAQAGVARRSRLCRDGVRHLLEIVDVSLDVVVGVHDRRRPRLPFRSGRLEHAPVQLPEPRELRDPVIDVPEVSILVDRLGVPIDRTLCAEELHRRRQPELRDHVVASLEHGSDPVEFVVGVLREDLGQVRSRGCHREGVAVERADLFERAVDDHRHRVLGAADRAAREPAAERLRQTHDVGHDVEGLHGPAPRDREPGLHLVEGEERPVRVTDLPEPREVARIRQDYAAVRHHGLHDHPGDPPVVLCEGLRRGVGVVEGTTTTCSATPSDIPSVCGTGNGWSREPALSLGGKTLTINESWWPWYDPSIFMIRFRPVSARMIRTASSVDSVPELPKRQYGSRYLASSSSATTSASSVGWAKCVPSSTRRWTAS